MGIVEMAHRQWALTQYQRSQLVMMVTALHRMVMQGQTCPAQNTWRSLKKRWTFCRRTLIQITLTQMAFQSSVCHVRQPRLLQNDS
eukprot:12012575-Karenia_brevis.AAC.1